MAAQRRKKTARKKSATKAVAKRTSSAVALPTELADEFAPFINRDQATATTAGWPWISTVGSSPQMKVSGQPVGGADFGLEAIILGGARANVHYPSKYEPGKQQDPPDCYAIADPSWKASEVEERMAPPENLASKRSERCGDCVLNAFGSGQGNAKACSNTVRLAVLPGDPETLEKADLTKLDGCMLSVPPGSLKTWTGYAQHVVKGLSRPLGTVVSKIRKVPNEQTAGFTFGFELLDVVQSPEMLRALLSRMKGDAAAALTQPPPTAIGGDAKSGGGGAGPRRRKVTRKKSKAAKKR